MIVFSLSAIQACTSSIAIVDSAEVDQAQLAADTAECKEYASQIKHSDKVIEFAFLGGLIAGLSEWVFTGDEDFARSAALLGAIEGGIVGASEAMYDHDEIVKNCLSGRGYMVLN